MERGQPDEAIVSKGEFARICNVSPGRVTQWISDGKIAGAALVGEGRSARIDVRAAQAQLKRHLDPNQMTANGIRTRIPTGPLVEPPPSPAAAKHSDHDPEPQDEGGEDDSLATDLTLERAGLAREQKLNWRLRNATLRGELIDAAEAEHRWVDAIIALRSRVLGVIGDLALALPHLSAHDLATIDREIRSAMDIAAGSGEP